MTSYVDLINTIEFNDKMKNYLNSDEKQYFVHMCNNYTYIFNELESMIVEILKDGMIDYHDIPILVIYLSKAYAHIHVPNNNVKIFKLFKFTLEICILKNIGIDVITSNQIHMVNTVIDRCTELIELNPYSIKSNVYKILSCKCLKRNNRNK